MINIPTVLVLGAGASKPYGYPTGQELLVDIVRSFSDTTKGSQNYDLYDKAGFDNEMVNQYVHALKYSGQSSVDRFLERRTDLMEVGKFSIAHQLMNKEHSGALFGLDDRSNSWYRYLYNRMDTDLDSFGDNQISIITFNYDLSLEHFLFVSLKNTFGYDDDEIGKQMENIKIVHVHGKLGNLPWEKAPLCEYDNKNITWEEVLEASEQISIVSEDIEKYPHFKEARNELIPAERVIFLGFGYDEINMRRLNIQDLYNKDLVGTGFEMGDGNRRSIEKTWEKQELSIQALDIMDLFNNWMPLE